MKIRRITLAAAAIAAALGFAAQPLHAFDSPKITVFTVTDPIQVGDTTLNAGTYAIRVVDHGADLKVLQVTDKSRQTVYATFQAMQHQLLDSKISSDGTLHFDRVPGEALLLRSWDVPNRSFGYDIVTRVPKASDVAKLAVKGSPLVKSAK